MLFFCLNFNIFLFFFFLKKTKKNKLSVILFFLFNYFFCTTLKVPWVPFPLLMHRPNRSDIIISFLFYIFYVFWVFFFISREVFQSFKAFLLFLVYSDVLTESKRSYAAAVLVSLGLRDCYRVCLRDCYGVYVTVSSPARDDLHSLGVHAVLLLYNMLRANISNAFDNFKKSIYLYIMHL